MPSIYLVPCFISIILLAFALKSRFGVDSALAPIAAVEALSLALVLLGMANILKLGAILLLFASLAAGVFFIIKDKKGFAEFISSPAAVAFIAGSVVLWASYEIHGAFYFAYDEYSHWGPFFKGVFVDDCLHIYSSHQMFHPTYPQGVQSFYYYLSQLAPSFRETDTFIAMGVVISAGVTPLLFGSSWKKPVKSALCVLTVPLFLAVFPYCDAYISTYFDAILGVVFGACAVAVLVCDVRSLKDAAVVALGCMMLTQMKANGFLLALVCIAMFVIKSLFDCRRGTIPGEKKRRFLPSIIVAGSSAAAFLLWKLALRLTGNGADQFNQRQFGGFFEEISSALAGQNERVSACWNGFKINFVHMPIAYNGYGTPLVILLLLTASTAVFGVWMWKRKKERGAAAVVASAPLFCLAYLFSIFYTYVCYMNYYESTINASYPRYVSTFFIGWLMLAVAAFFIYGDEFVSVRGRAVFPCLVSLALVALIAKSCLSRDVLNMKQTHEEVARPALDNICAQVSDSIGDDGKTMCLFNNDIVYVHIFRYFCFEENIPLDLTQSLDGMTRSEMAAYLSDNSIEHAIVYILSDEFVSENAELFSDNLEYFLQTECPCVYDVELDGGEVRFSLRAATSLGAE